jgi:RND family efflux transporter MFP subunit
MLQEHRRVTGELRAVARSQVATIEPGLVVRRPVEEGQIVRAGDVLAVLDARRLELELRRLEAEAKVAGATVDARTSEYEMEQRDVEKLREVEARGASNPKELADAGSELNMASARLEAARQDEAVIQARAALARTRLEDMTVRAPFDGVVVQSFAEAGQWMGEGATIAEIVSVGACEAWLDVPQRFAEAVIGRRRPVQVSIDAIDRSVPATVPVVVPNVDRVGRSFKVFIRIEDDTGVLAPGMSVTGWVPTGDEAKFLTVPRNALLRNDAGYYVYVARSSGPGPAQAAPMPVAVAFEAGERVAVHPGALSPGDLVVVEGNERLFPMMPVSFAPPDAQSAGPGGR